MTALLDRPRARPSSAPATRPQARPRGGPSAVPHLTVIGDFACPWSYLAFRRAAVLAAAGVRVDWLAVEHDPWTPGREDDRPARLRALQDEMPRVIGRLLPGERLPYDLAGFVPPTRATVAAYAEATAAGVAHVARRVLFESFWMHGIDIGDPRILRILMIDELRSGSSGSEAVREWGYPVDVTGAPISTEAWRLVDGWRRRWRELPAPVVPALHVAGQEPVLGVAAVDWLGDAIVTRGLEPDPPPAPGRRTPPGPVLAAPGWVTDIGGPWLRRLQHLPESPYPGGR